MKITDELKVALNNSLDFNNDKTRTYASIIVEYEGLDPKKPESFKFFEPSPFIPNTLSQYPYVRSIETHANMFLNHGIKNQNGFYDMIYASQWIELKDLNQHVFSYNESFDIDYLGQKYAFPNIGGGVSCGILKKAIPGGGIDQYNADELYDFIRIKSIKIKLLHDMYFDQIGSFDEQVNTTQAYTYLLYENKEDGEYFGPNVQQLSSSGSMHKYTPGLLEIENEHITPSHSLVFETSGNTIYINAEDIEISGEVTVEDGYDLIIQSLYSIELLDGADIGKNITLRIKKDWFDLEPFAYMDNSEVYNFCNNSEKYKANELDPLPRKRLEKEIAERKLEEMLKKEMPIDIAIHPNPADQQITISKLQREAHALVIYDLKGVVVFSQDVSGKDHTVIDVSNFTGGVYIVAVDRENGTVSRKRFVKL